MNILPMDRSSMGRIYTPTLTAWSPSLGSRQPPKAFSLLRATALRLLASIHLLHSLIKITGHVFSTKTTCHVIPTCKAIPSWWLIMHKNLNRVKPLFLTSAHHPTQTKQTKSDSIGIKFVLFATNRRLEALWHSNKLLCSIKWKTRAAAASWKTTSSLNLMTWKKRQTNNADLGTQRLLSLHDYSRDQRRTRRRRRSIPISGTTSSAIQWRSNAPSTENRCTANTRNGAETFHREVSSTKKSLTRMTTLLVSANACKDLTIKRNWFYFIPWGSQLFNLNIPQYTYDSPILTDGQRERNFKFLFGENGKIYWGFIKIYL